MARWLKHILCLNQRAIFISETRYRVAIFPDKASKNPVWSWVQAIKALHFSCFRYATTGVPIWLYSLS